MSKYSFLHSSRCVVGGKVTKPIKMLSMIIYRKELINSSFFDVCISLGVADLMYLVNEQFVWSFMEWFAPCWRFSSEFAVQVLSGLVHQCHQQVWGQLNFFKTEYIYQVDIYTMLLLSFNRYTAFRYPIKYKNVGKEQCHKMKKMLRNKGGF